MRVGAFRAAATLATALLLLGGAGCASGITSSVKKTVEEEFARTWGPKIASSVNPPGRDLFKDGVTALMSEFGRILPDRARVLGINVNGGTPETRRSGAGAVTTSSAIVKIDVQQVASPALVDEYLWSHQLGFRGPKGTRDLGTAPLSTRVFNLDDVDWSKLPQMGTAAVTASGVPDGAPTTVVVEKGLGVEGALVVQINVSSDRGDASVRFTPAGELIGKVGT